MTLMEVFKKLSVGQLWLALAVALLPLLAAFLGMWFITHELYQVETHTVESMEHLFDGIGYLFYSHLFVILVTAYVSIGLNIMIKQWTEKDDDSSSKD